MRTCEIEGCERKHRAKGLCFIHYYKQYNKQYYQRNYEHRRKQIKKHQQSEKGKEVKKKYQQSEKGKIKNKRYREKHPEYVYNCHLQMNKNKGHGMQIKTHKKHMMRILKAGGTLG